MKSPLSLSLCFSAVLRGLNIFAKNCDCASTKTISCGPGHAQVAVAQHLLRMPCVCQTHFASG